MKHNTQNRLPKPKNSKALLSKLRLITASEILRYISDNTGSLAHIQADAHIAELCDRYTLRILLNWLATKYGLPAYTKESSSTYFALESFACLATEYPFNDDGYPLDEQDRAQLLSLLVQKTQSLLNTGFEPHLQLAGDLYEEIYANSLSTDHQGQVYIQKERQNKSTGMFYTPQTIVNHCLKYGLATTLNGNISSITESLKQASSHDLSKQEANSETFCIFDPACGSGNFLHGTTSYLLTLALPIQNIYAFAKHCLYGNDIDAGAVSLCRLLTVISLAPYFQELSLRGHSFLNQGMQDLMEQLRLHIKVNDPLVEALGTSSQAKFDLVITNPPYISYGARGQEKLSSGWQKLIKQQLPHGGEYKIRLHSLFQELCIKRTKVNGHTLMLVPDAFLTGQHYAKLRRFILKESKIISLNILSQRAFNKVCAGRWCIAVYKKLNTKDDANRNDNTAYSVTLRDIDKAQSTTIDLQDLVSTDFQRFQLLFTQQDRNIFSRLRQLPALKTYLTGHTGVRAKAGRDSIVANCSKANTWKKGLISGSQINPFRVAEPTHFINIDSTKLYAGGFDPCNIASAKIMVRQTGDKLIAALDEAGLYHLNNIHSFVPNASINSLLPQIEQIDFLNFVTALMNSRLWLYLYQMKSQEQDRIMAQIDIEIVENLPLPMIEGNERVIVEVSRLVQEILSGTVQRKSAGIDNLVMANKEAITTQIDSLIYGVYELSQDEVDHINNLYPASKFDEHQEKPLLLRK